MVVEIWNEKEVWILIVTNPEFARILLHNGNKACKHL